MARIMRKSMAGLTKPTWMWMLWALFGTALLIRVWGTWYGLPFSYYADEYHEVMRALQLGTGSFNFERTGKGGFYLLLFIEYGVYFVVLNLVGVVNSAQDFAILFVRDQSAFYLMGRVTAATLGALTVGTVFYLARQAYTTNAGLLAALFLAVNVLHIDLSRLIGVDVFMTFLATVVLYFGLKIIATGRRADYLLAGLFAGLATTTKLPAIMLIVPLLVAHSYAVKRDGGGLLDWFARRELWLAAIVFAAVLVITNPLFFVKLASSVAWRLTSSVPTSAAAVAADGAVLEVLGGRRPNLFVYYLSAIEVSMGWPLFVLALSALVHAVWKRTQADVMLLSYALVHYVAIASTSSAVLYYPRYALPLIVVLIVLAGRTLADVVASIRRARMTATAGLIVVCLALPVSQSIATAYSLTKADARTLALQWFNSNVPPGSRVLIEGSKISAQRETVQLRESTDSLRRRIEYWRSVEPKQAKFLEYQLAAHEGGGYQLVLMSSDSVASLDTYLVDNVEYFVVRPHAIVSSRKMDRTGRRLLSDLRSDPRVRLVNRFVGGEKERLASSIEIYQRVESRLPVDGPSATEF